MITFLPKRPDCLTPEIWRSKAGDEAADEGYKWYCECYYKFLGDGHYDQHRAEMMGREAGLYMALICSQKALEKAEGL